jgi:hypothetical protein
MQELKTVSLRPKTQTVSVYTRHSADCSKKGEPQWRRCRCAKYLYLLRDGKNKTVSAKTRSWDKAEQQAQEIRESWDPVKQKLRELDQLKQTQEVGEVTISYALDRWLISVKADSDSGNEHTIRGPRPPLGGRGGPCDDPTAILQQPAAKLARPAKPPRTPSCNGESGD